MTAHQETTVNDLMLGAQGMAKDELLLLLDGDGEKLPSNGRLRDIARARATIERLYADLEDARRFHTNEHKDRLAAEAERDELRAKLTAPAGAASAKDDAVPDWLRGLGDRIRTQDNRITADPIFIVQERRDYVGSEGYNSDSRTQWVCDDNLPADETENAQLEAEFQRTLKEPNGWRRLDAFPVWEFVTACFTEQGCKDYIKANGHNHKELRIFAAGSFRNQEWRQVREWIKNLPAVAPTSAASAKASRYPWKDAPEWAMWAATCSNGRSFWYSHWPYLAQGVPDRWEFDSRAAHIESIPSLPCHDWRDSLEPRPTGTEGFSTAADGGGE